MKIGSFAVPSTGQQKDNQWVEMSRELLLICRPSALCRHEMWQWHQAFELPSRPPGTCPADQLGHCIPFTWSRSSRFWMDIPAATKKKNGPRQPERRKEIEIAAHLLRVPKHIYINKTQFIWINWTNPLTWKVGLVWICYPTHPQSNSHHSSDIAESSRHRFPMLFPLFLLVHISHLY